VSMSELAFMTCSRTENREYVSVVIFQDGRHLGLADCRVNHVSEAACRTLCIFPHAESHRALIVIKSLIERVN